MQTVTTIGLDIAKSVFQVHGVDAGGQVVIRRQLKRRQVLAFFQRLPACLVGIEACASSHHWARELQRSAIPCVDATGLREALCQTAQERCDRCGGYLRGSRQGEYALRPDQDTGAAKLPDTPSYTPSAHPAADIGNQCHPGSSRGVWHRGSSRPQRCRATAWRCRGRK